MRIVGKLVISSPGRSCHTDSKASRYEINGNTARQRAARELCYGKTQNGYGVVPEQGTEFKYGNGHRGGCINRGPVLGGVPARYK